MLEEICEWLILLLLHSAENPKKLIRALGVEQR
jgi:hypothetical protein